MRDGRPVSPTTIWRWSQKPVKLPDGRECKLEAVRVGSRHMTSVEAVLRFIARQNPDAGTTATLSAGPSKANTDAALEREERAVAEALR